MKIIKLTKQEFFFLEENLSKGNFPYNIQFHLTNNQKDDLLDELGTLLQKFGFDKDYEITNKGRVIENLIDKLNG